MLNIVKNCIWIVFLNALTHCKQANKMEIDANILYFYSILGKYFGVILFLSPPTHDLYNWIRNYLLICHELIMISSRIKYVLDIKPLMVNILLALILGLWSKSIVRSVLRSIFTRPSVWNYISCIFRHKSWI